MTFKTEITANDILSLDDYAKVRKQQKQAVKEIKQNRRVAVGPDATFYFENYDTMLYQIHEMLFIEKGGDAQLSDELDAYNPLVPKGQELVATMMFEIDDPVRRTAFLNKMGGVENHIFLGVAGEKIQAVAEDDVERTNSDGKASSIQFLHFPLTTQQIAAFKNPESQITLSIEHDNYGHVAILNNATRAALAKDFSEI